jgi:small-conductance mechanosensitive channel
VSFLKLLGAPAGELLGRTYWGASLYQWGIALAVAAVLFLALRLLKGSLFKRFTRLAERTENQVDDVIALVMEKTSAFFLAAVAAYLGVLLVSLPEEAQDTIDRLIAVVLFLQAGFWAHHVAAFVLQGYARKTREEDPSRVAVLSLFGFFAQLAVWSVVVLLVLDNLGVNVTALIAGLGLGGIAVGLALQNVLKDTFASLSIILDKPFVVGDFIVVGDLLGVVERVGIKTTRVRSLSGEMLVFGNDDLLSSRIRNFKQMYERRVVFSLGVVYGTTPDELEAIPGMVREAVEANDHTRFDRAHFKQFGDSSLGFEVVYYVQSPDYNLYMDIQQAINLTLCRRFAEAGIEFAFPTRTIYLGGSPAAVPTAEPQLAEE